MLITPFPFKWSAKVVKDLTKPPYKKGDPKRIVVARGDNEVWHTEGTYMKKGEIPKRFEGVTIEPMDIRTIKQIIPYNMGDVLEITGDCDANGIPAVTLSNGALVNRLLLAYVMDGGGEVTLKGNGPLNPVCVWRGGDIIGLVMPMLKVR